jgi:hypothetical protein
MRSGRASIVDGDTLEILSGIDVPESNHSVATIA